MKSLGQDSRSLRRESNRVPSEYKSEVSLLEPTHPGSQVSEVSCMERDGCLRLLVYTGRNTIAVTENDCRRPLNIHTCVMRVFIGAINTAAPGVPRTRLVFTNWQYEACRFIIGVSFSREK
jgi:hypothetical protein